VKNGLVLNVILAQKTAIFHLSARENQPLLIDWSALGVVDHLLELLDQVHRVDDK